MRTLAALRGRDPRRNGDPFVRSVLVGALAGAIIMYFCDPAQGKLRRNMASDMLAARARRLLRLIARTGRTAAADAYGASQKVAHMQPEHWSVPNDATLARRVETELLRDRNIPKGRININAEAGIVVLRGEIDHPKQIREIEDAVGRMPGVRGVHNLLHLPGTPVPDRGSVVPAP